MKELPQRVLIEINKAIREAYMEGFEAGKKQGTTRIVGDRLMIYMAIIAGFVMFLAVAKIVV